MPSFDPVSMGYRGILRQGLLIVAMTLSSLAVLESRGLCDSASELRLQEIEQIKIILGRRSASGQKAELLLRLAELYSEQYRHDFLEEQRLQQEGKARKSLASSWLRSSNHACLALVQDHPQFKDNDHALYILGYNYGELGDQKQKALYFKKLIQQYPASPFSAEGYRILGEDAFSRRDFAEAEKLFSRASSFENLPSYPRTLYKLAWARFKRRDVSGALEAMQRVASLVIRDDRYLSLKEEALNDLVLFFSESNRKEQAREYFRRLDVENKGDEFYRNALFNLAKAYDKQGQFDKALSALNSIQVQGLDSHRLKLDVLFMALNLHEKAGHSQEAGRVLQQLVRALEEVQGSRDELLEKASEPLFRTWNQVRQRLKDRALDAHKSAQKSKDSEKARKLYAEATTHYRLFLRAFLASPKSENEQRERLEVISYLSECLVRADRTDEAIEVLRTSFDRDHGQQELRRKIGLSLLYHQEQMLKRARESGDRARRETLLLGDIERFQDEFSRDDSAVSLSFRKAFLKQDESSLLDLVEKFPSRKESLDAARYLVSSSLAQGRVSEVRERIQKFSGMAVSQGVEGASLRKYMQEVRDRVDFESAQKAEHDGDIQTAKLKYAEIAQRSGNKDIQQKALFNASINAIHQADFDGIVSLLNQNQGTKMPKSDLVEIVKLLGSEGVNRISLAEYDVAYRFFELGERLDPKGASARPKWIAMMAAIVGDNLISSDRAEGLKSSIKKCDSANCYPILLDYARWLMDSERYTDAEDLLKDSLGAGEAAIDGMLALVILLREKGRLADSHRLLLYLKQVARKMRLSNGPIRDRIDAKLKLEELMPSLFDFQQSSFEGSSHGLQGQFKRKLSQIQNWERQLGDISRKGDGSVYLRSMFWLAKVFSVLAHQIRQAPIPESLTADERKAYEQGVERMVQPLLEKAASLLRIAQEKAQKAFLLNEDLTRVQGALYQLTGQKSYGVTFAAGQHAKELSGVAEGRKKPQVSSEVMTRMNSGDMGGAFGILARHELSKDHSWLAQALLQQIPEGVRSKVSGILGLSARVALVRGRDDVAFRLLKEAQGKERQEENSEMLVGLCLKYGLLHQLSLPLGQIGKTSVAYSVFDRAFKILKGDAVAGKAIRDRRSFSSALNMSDLYLSWLNAASAEERQEGSRSLENEKPFSYFVRKEQ